MIRLHGYWRSTASYRVRIALNLKGVDHAHVLHDLRGGEQRSPEYLSINPQGLVPTLEIDGEAIAQSLAIMEWLDERYPDPPLLPPNLRDRAIVRSMAAVVCADIHPLNNLRVLRALRDDLAASEEQVQQWMARWIDAGFATLEQMIARHGKGFAVGDKPTMADCCLVPQVYSARRFGVDLSPYPHIRAVDEIAQRHPAFAKAHPDRQADADPA